MLEFLRIHPFSNPKVFDTEIAKPWLKSPERDFSRMKKLVRCVSLCRTKAVIDLPKREDLVSNLRFSPQEQEFYDLVKESTIQRLDTALSSNPLPPGQYLNALQWLNELRLICNHGLAHTKRERDKTITVSPPDMASWNKSAANKAFATMICAEQVVCSVCYNVLVDGAGGVNSASLKPHLAQCLNVTCGSCFKDLPGGRSVLGCCQLPSCKSFEVTWTHNSASQTGAELSPIFQMRTFPQN